MIVEAFFDGGCRPNPGPAASAAIIRDLDGRTLRHVGRAHEHATVNVAEWSALILALEAARDLGATEVRVFGDSKLVVEQFSGNYAIHEPTLRVLALAASKVRVMFPGGAVATWIPREKNRAADAICNAVLDGTYRPDGDLDDVADVAEAVTVSYVVDVTMAATEAREARATGSTEAQLRKRLAERAERAILLNGRVGGDTYRAMRVKG